VARARAFIELIAETFRRWSSDRAERLGAALAYYALFSLAPLLVIVIAIAGLVFGEAAARGQIVQTAQNLIGPDAARTIESLVANVRASGSGGVATIVSLILLVIGGSNVFGQLKDSLNLIWGIQPKPDANLAGGILRVLGDRLLSIAMLFNLGLLWLVALALNIGITALSGWLQNLLPGASFVWRGGNVLFGFLISTLLFAAIYKVLPDASTAWRDVWIGAAFTSVLFTLGTLLIGLYLGNSGIASVYGAAGSLVAIVLWTYYSAQIFFFGAEFIQVFAEKHGMSIRPARGAVQVRRTTPVSK